MHMACIPSSGFGSSCLNAYTVGVTFIQASCVQQVLPKQHAYSMKHTLYVHPLQAATVTCLQSARVIKATSSCCCHAGNTIVITIPWHLGCCCSSIMLLDDVQRLLSKQHLLAVRQCMTHMFCRCYKLSTLTYPARSP
jgi:hypothetical protein